MTSDSRHIDAADAAAAEAASAAPSSATAETGRPAIDADLDTTAVVQGLEAVLFLAEEPVPLDELAALVEREPSDVETLLEQLAAEHEQRSSGIEVRRAAGGWRMYTAAAARPVLERWALAGRTGRLTQAALETLAVIAYKQPISRQDISEIRGVSADGAVRNLVARGLVTEVGRDPGPGQAVLYGTTTVFLERLGLDDLDQLPELTTFLPEAPAPDEPDPAALRDIRRRLAAGEELPSRSLGGRTAEETNTGAGDPDPDDADDEVLPAPTAASGGRRDDEVMSSLTDQLETAARNAVARLRAAVDAGDGDDARDAGGDRDDGADDDGAGDAQTDTPEDGTEVATRG